MTMKRQGAFPAGTPPQLQKKAQWQLKAVGTVDRIETYCVNTVDFLTYVPYINQEHPSIDGLWCVNVSSSDEALGLTYYTVTWEGVRMVYNAIPPPVYYLNGTRVSAPIETFKWFGDLISAATQIKGAATWDPDSGKFLGFGKNSADPSLIGVQVYDDTAVTWRVSYLWPGYDRSWMSSLQKICIPKGPYPTLPGGRNWKLSDFSERSVAQQFNEYNLTFEASGPGGWAELIYDNSHDQ